MNRPRLLDLYCCAGGAAVGYHRAGFEVVGVDIAPQPNYPFEFHQADAIDFVTAHGHEFDAVHASAPCQTHCTLTKGNRARPGWRDSHPDLVAPTREALIHTGRPFVMENVPTAPLRRDVVLCGEMFDLAVIRHRVFELGGWTTTPPAHRKHRGRVAGMRHGQWFEGPYFAVYGEGGGKGTIAQWQQAMGITWTGVRRELAEAIPPAYTHWIGTRLQYHITAGRPLALAA
ncbi:DNA methylase [Amycolatopsis thermoflava]|uniref:DNA methylase n=1 Tax=Amycolatopsis thermoflava TaxID=84480 RepID=UPI003D755904